MDYSLVIRSFQLASEGAYIRSNTTEKTVTDATDFNLGNR